MAPDPRLTIRVAASAAGLRQATTAFDEFRANFGLRETGVWQIQVSLDEILSNIVRRTPGGTAAQVIEITFALEDDRLETTVVDDGPAFDPLQLPPPDLTAPLDDRRPGGLGVYLVRELMERVDYARVEGRNRLVMTWRRPGPAPGDA
jgi:serine/threonine-protein kinase RsbW